MFDIPGFPADEGQAIQPPHEKEITAGSLDHAGRYMRGKRNALADGGVGDQHDGYRLEGNWVAGYGAAGYAAKSEGAVSAGRLCANGKRRGCAHV